MDNSVFSSLKAIRKMIAGLINYLKNK